MLESWNLQDFEGTFLTAVGKCHSKRGWEGIHDPPTLPSFLICCRAWYPVKSPCKKHPDKRHRAISHPSKSHLGQKLPQTKCPRYKKPPKQYAPDTRSPKNNMPPNQFVVLKAFLPCQERVLVTEERPGLQRRAPSALHSKPMSSLGWGETNFTLVPMLLTCSSSEQSKVQISIVAPRCVSIRSRAYAGVEFYMSCHILAVLVWAYVFGGPQHRHSVNV